MGDEDDLRWRVRCASPCAMGVQLLSTPREDTSLLGVVGVSIARIRVPTLDSLPCRCLLSGLFLLCRVSPHSVLRTRRC